MTEQDMLLKAAHRAGIASGRNPPAVTSARCVARACCSRTAGGSGTPYHDDADALRLAVAIPWLNLKWVTAEAWQVEPLDSEARQAYVRRAIVNASIMPGSDMANIEKALLTEICEVIELARKRVQRAVNSAMVEAYWQIGRLIVEHEQQGEARAIYGAQQLQYLAERLTAEFGRGFDVTNLRNMRRFYQAFPKQDTLCLELSWSHYRTLLKVESDTARRWYMRETAEQDWSVRALARQIEVLYYEWLLSSQDRDAVQQEAEQRTQPLHPSRRDYLRDPYILDFSEPAG